MKDISKKKLIKLVFIFILFILSDYLVYIPIKLLNITNIGGPTLVILNSFKDIILLFILFLIYRKELIKEWDIFRANAFDHIDTGLKYWFIGLIIMACSNLLINYLFKTGSSNNEQIVQSYISSLPWLMLIDAGIIAPIIEEIVFRKSFKDTFKKSSTFIIASGLVFGLMHIVGSYESPIDLLYLVPYGALGCAFAKAYDKTDTLFTSISLHMIHNLILVIVSIISMGRI